MIDDLFDLLDLSSLIDLPGMGSIPVLVLYWVLLAEFLKNSTTTFDHKVYSVHLLFKFSFVPLLFCLL